jgi:hypothetical protein
MMIITPIIAITLRAISVMGHYQKRLIIPGEIRLLPTKTQPAQTHILDMQQLSIISSITLAEKVFMMMEEVLTVECTQGNLED